MCLRPCLAHQKKYLPFVREVFLTEVLSNTKSCHKPSPTDNPKQRKPLLLSSSDSAPVIGQSCGTHTRQ